MKINNILFVLGMIFYFNAYSIISFNRFIPRRYVYIDEIAISKYNLTNEQLQNIQYYNSNKFNLNRKIKNTDTVTKGGKIRLENGIKIEKIIVAKKTPCIAFNVSNDEGGGHTLKIGFDASNKGNYIEFYSNSGTNFVMSHPNVTDYDGKTFEVYSSKTVRLLVRKREIKKIDRSIKGLSGIKIK